MKLDGEQVNLPYGTKVMVELGVLRIEGIIVGKATNDISQSHIVKCTDDSLPNKTYAYDVFVATLGSIELLTRTEK